MFFKSLKRLIIRNHDVCSEPDILFFNTNQSLLYSSKFEESSEIVIAVPHHSPLGITNLPCEEHKEADENSGYLGYNLSKLIKCPIIIACNYFIDSNKHEDSDYFKKILKWNPKILIEIHGHSSKSANFDIEISAGHIEKNKWSIELASKIKQKINDYSISGDYNEIYFKASKTKTINTDKWLGFHIELPKKLRSSKNEYSTFLEILAKSIKEVLVEYNNYLNTSGFKNS